jgi:hypothetical protein
MIKAIVGCITVICCGILLMPWLVDTGLPPAPTEVPSSRRLAVTDFASGALAAFSNDRIGTD